MSDTIAAERPAALAGPALTGPAAAGTVRVLGGAGTGKSTLLVDAAAARVAAGTPPESVLLLSASARSHGVVRAALSTALLGAHGTGTCGARPAVVREPLVRTVHAYAFAVLRMAARRAGTPQPRLVTGAERDAVIRDMLAGDLADGAASATGWPESLRPALATQGFATELRDLLARCTERGVDPVALRRLGRRSGRPEWVAAGRFAQAYEQVMLLRSAVGSAAPQATVPALGAAELVDAALDALAADPELLAAERARIRVLLVDDAQHLDPRAALLVRVLAAGADLAVFAGDPDQRVFGYRGAEPALLTEGDEPTIVLERSWRGAPVVVRALRGVAGRLPGTAATRDVVAADPDRPGSVTVRIEATAHAEAAVIADALRRAHLVDGMPYAAMAVVLRSAGRSGPALIRALGAVGVPVDRAPVTRPLAEHPAVWALLTVLGAVRRELDGDAARALLTGPIGRVDPVALRRLRRLFAHAGAEPGADPGDLLAAALDGRADGPRLPADLGRAVRRVRVVLDAARDGDRAGADPRVVLWQAWQRSGLQRRWTAGLERGGAAGERAGADLDAVTALFDVAEQYAGRTAGASCRGLVEHVRAMTLPPVAPPTDRQRGVAVLSAHAAVGGEWEFVVIAGLQQGVWPSTAGRGGVLGTQRLLDVLDGVGEPGRDGSKEASEAVLDTVSDAAPALAAERRLLVAALGVARSHVLVTAVDGAATGGDESLIPSPFCDELAALSGGAAPFAGADPGAPGGGTSPTRRPLTAAALIGRLRAVLCAPDTAEPVRARAAAQLARLAAAGVPGADPQQWHGTRAWSTGGPVAPDGGVVTLSPSTVRTLIDCPLRWLLEGHGGRNARDVRTALGSVVHALVAEPDAGEGRLVAELESVWQALPPAAFSGAGWHRDNEFARHRSMVEAFAQWRERTRGEFTEVGTEVDVEGELIAVPQGSEPGGGPAVRMRGRIDRLERDAQGRLVVVDLKTGKTPVSKDDAQRHAQLATYQLAIGAGAMSAEDRAGGGRLVYLGKLGVAGATERDQDPMTEDAGEQWRAEIAAAAAATRGAEFTARVNDGCTHCPVRPACPAHAPNGGLA